MWKPTRPSPGALAAVSLVVSIAAVALALFRPTLSPPEASAAQQYRFGFDAEAYDVVALREDSKGTRRGNRVPIKGPHGHPQTTYVPVYAVPLALQRGDLVYLNTQVETTNNTSSNVMMGLQITVEGRGNQQPQQISPSTTQNVTPGMHHLPMHTTAVFKVPRTGEYRFTATVHAAAGGELVSIHNRSREPFLKIEEGYGNLIAMVFRPRH